ncbi:uncharacterized protein LOC111330203 [Stylophora pistillata]|nr:uncharacterized protein LOC111330203 [Stylophora pistillata]
MIGGCASLGDNRVTNVNTEQSSAPNQRLPREQSHTDGTQYTVNMIDGFASIGDNSVINVNTEQSSALPQRLPQQRLPQQRLPQQRLPQQRLPQQRLPQQRSLTGGTKYTVDMKGGFASIGNNSVIIVNTEQSRTPSTAGSSNSQFNFPGDQGNTDPHNPETGAPLGESDS